MNKTNASSQTGWIALIIGVTFLTYLPVLAAGFTNYDDGTHLLNNALVRSLHPDHLRAIFTTSVHATYIPLTVLSFAVEHHFFGFDPFVYHLDNLLLHMGVVLLVFFLARRLGASAAGAGVGALIFAVHPMHVESVAWVTERKDVLYAFFYLLSVVSYLRYLQEGRREGYYLSFLFALLSIFAKPMAVSLPLVLLLTEWFVSGKVDARRLAEKIPHTIAVGVIGLITYLSHARAPMVPPAEGVLIWVWSLAFYLGKFFFPVDLSPLYPAPEPVGLQNPAYATSAAVVGVALLVWMRFRKNRWVNFAFLYFFFSIFFLLRFDVGRDVNVVADRFMYLPSLGFCLLIGSTAALLFEKNKENRFRRPLIQAGTAALLLILAVAATRQVRIWDNSVVLWTHAMRYAPDNLMVYVNRADALITGGQVQNAAADYRAAKGIYQRTRQGIGPMPDDEQVRTQELARLSAVVDAHPESADGYMMRGIFYASHQQTDLALSDFNRGIVLEPSDESAYINRGILFGQNGRMEEALADANKALEIKPNWGFAHLIRGNLLMEAGRLEEAAADYTAAIAQAPTEAKYYLNRGMAFRRLGRGQEAREDLDTAIRLSPRMVNGYMERAEWYGQNNQWPEALADYSRIILINDSIGEVYWKRSAVYRRLGFLNEAVKDAFKADMLGASPPDNEMSQLIHELQNKGKGQP